MIPVLYKIGADTALSAVVLYLVALALVAYTAYMGWRGAEPIEPPKSDAERKKLRQEQLQRAGGYGVAGAVLAGIGLRYALPANLFPGGQGTGIPIHTYGILLASGFLSAVVLSAKVAEKEWRGEEGVIKRDQVFDLALWVFVAGIGGSRLLFMIVNWKDYSGHLGEYFSSPSKLVDCLSGGLVFYGGLIGATLAAVVYCRRHQIDFMRLADIGIPTVSLGQCLGRLGCFSAGCCWGDISAQGFKLGVHFPGSAEAKTILGTVSNVASLAFQSQAGDTGRWVLEATGEVFHQYVPGAVKISEWAFQHGHTLPVHPTQLYESIGQFVLFLTLMMLRRARRFHGQIFGMWLMAYAILRSTVELFRGDLERGTLAGLLGELGMGGRISPEAWYNLSTSQFISICMFGLGATILYRRGREVLRQPTAGSAAASA